MRIYKQDSQCPNINNPDHKKKRFFLFHKNKEKLHL